MRKSGASGGSKRDRFNNTRGRRDVAVGDPLAGLPHPHTTDRVPTQSYHLTSVGSSIPTDGLVTSTFHLSTFQISLVFPLEMERYSPVDPAQLIECVRSHDVLYNALSSDYSNVRVKYELWERIGRRFNMPGEQIKDVWQKLRDCHREALRRKKNKAGPSLKSKMWKYEKEMEFLLPYMKDRARQSSSSKQPVADPEMFTYYGNDACNVLCEVKQEFANWSQTEEENSEQDAEPVNKRLRRGRRNLQEEQPEPPVATWPENLEDWENPHYAIQSDPLRQFFDAMYLATLHLTPAMQRRVKRDLFNSVTAAEEELECSVAPGCSTSTN